MVAMIFKGSNIQKGHTRNNLDRILTSAFEEDFLKKKIHVHIVQQLSPSPHSGHNFRQTIITQGTILTEF